MTANSPSKSIVIRYDLMILFSLILAVLKGVEIISISWWIVFLPLLLPFAVLMLLETLIFILEVFVP